MAAVTARTLINDAMMELGLIDETDVASGDDASRALRILNRDIMDPWNVQKPFSLGSVFTTGSFAASTQTRLIGPTGTGSFTLDPRPTEILSAQRVDTATNPDTYYPLRVRDAAWYASKNQPLYESTYITDIYYDPAATLLNGTLYAWPVPSAAQSVRVETNAVTSVFATLDTSLNLAQGYESAISHTLKELLADAFGIPTPPGLAAKAQKARTIIEIQNLRLPIPLRTDAPGMPGHRHGSDIVRFRTRDY